MRLLYRTTIDDMVAVFLKAEIASERFGEKVRVQLARDGKERSIVDRPEITNQSENGYRRHLLASYRAYVFAELPVHTVVAAEVIRAGRKIYVQSYFPLQ